MGLKMNSLKISLLVFIFCMTVSAQWFWQNPLPQGNRLRSVCFVDSQTGLAVGGNGTILKTTDGGDNWSSQNSGTTEVLMSVYFIDSDIGWAVGGEWVGKILKTTNGGENWEMQTSSAIWSLVSIYFSDNQTGWTVGPLGTIQKTTNGGENWEVALVTVISGLFTSQMIKPVGL